MERFRHARAAERACGLYDIFDRDSSYVVHGCWFSSKGGEMKSLDFNRIIEFICFSYDFNKSARAQVFWLEKIGRDHFGCLYVFVTSDVEILRRLVVLETFRHARAAERACGLYGFI